MLQCSRSSWALGYALKSPCRHAQLYVQPTQSEHAAFLPFCSQTQVVLHLPQL